MLFETNTVVWASAGTGKTRKLVDVYLELLERGMDPGRIVAVTFTERAAAEMRDRIRTALADRQGRWTAAISSLAAAPILTIHGFFGILLRQHGIVLGIEPSSSGLDEQQSIDLLRDTARPTIRKKILSANEDAENLFRDSGGLLPRIGQIAGVPRSSRLTKLAGLYLERFLSKKRAWNAVDSDDLLLGTRNRLREHNDIRRPY